MTQTLALLLDAYRELNSKKLFWFTLALSALVVGAMASFGINEKGLTFLHFQMDTPIFTSEIIPPSTFYKFVFSSFGIPVWLTWAATILALISTASIIPDFIAGGSVELTLSKPIGRVRLFLTKYATGLLFVGLQVLAFSLGSFIVVGIRGHTWEPRLFLAIPIVLCFFSYLFCLCALFGLLTRSTIASLLLTGLCWMCLFGVNAADGILLGQREAAILNHERATRLSDKAATAARERYAKENPPAEGEQPKVLTDTELEAFSAPVTKAKARLRETEESVVTWKRWSRIVMLVKTALPKTDNTIELLDRWLMTEAERERFGRAQGDSASDDEVVGFGRPDPELARRIDAANRKRPVRWIVGTSLGFEAVILAIACWVFVRRDF